MPNAQEEQFVDVYDCVCRTDTSLSVHRVCTYAQKLVQFPPDLEVMVRTPPHDDMVEDLTVAHFKPRHGSLPWRQRAGTQPLRKLSMYEEMHARIRKEMDEWLVGEVPPTIQRGVELTSAHLQYLVAQLTGYGDVKVDVWQSWGQSSLLRFEYIYMDGPKAVFGWYLVDTRFWDHHGIVPASMDSDEVSPS